MVLTDSGGIPGGDDRARRPVPDAGGENTERPITILEGTNRLVGSDPNKIVAEALAILDGPPRKGRIPEYWDGRAAERIADVLDRNLP